jgi:hypothetical protein
MTTPVAASSIAAQAFAELALRPLSSYGDDTPEALEAASALLRARALVLGSYDWSFARRLVPLAAMPDGLEAADPHLPYTFSLPAATQALRGVFLATDFQHAVRWRRDGALIRAAETPVVALVSVDLAREDLLPAAVQYAMALQMAVLMAPRYVTTRAKDADLQDKLRAALGQARSDDQVSASHHRLDGLDPGYGDDWVARVTL